MATGPTVTGDVAIGRRNTFAPGVVIYGPAVIGDDNFFGAYSVIGGRCRQAHRRSVARHGTGAVHIGNGNYFGEHSVVHGPIGNVTVVRDNSSVGAGTVLAHDTHTGSHVTLSVNCVVGGHSVLLDWSGLGIGSTLHPRTVMGQWSYAGMAAVVTRTVRPGHLVIGNPARPLRPNYEAFVRSGLDAMSLTQLREFLETGEIPEGPVLVSRAVAEFETAVAQTVRNRVLRSWADVESERSRAVAGD
ncbi:MULTISPECIES: hypothetical protein [Streptomyces]|uniref:Acyl-[acyl-carrier-protein]--UDP-N-acetylglucosamine O-acyltransferase n=1 Tax=Streptomyces doudnae TaxID=3075536 RepID=A0ABD5EN20_9ACTN|nr:MULTISPECIES: hypothetical protein [unclassified Streptomyces]MDT0436000.1 hypothetical protein [Streptomyces sp. DSM 41981]MYQ64552.1 hypothetical protein [Streptomyces sp. SID4950]SCD81345.1 acyl-[acyl-carrier-protein]--UDP-N-acetylglucosamine O-acyltransferase [Streptomyces sp. SolWspMP-5a-2]